MSWAKVVFFFNLLNELAFSFIDLCYYFLHLYFIYTCSNSYGVFLSTNFPGDSITSALALTVSDSQPLPPQKTLSKA